MARAIEKVWRLHYANETTIVLIFSRNLFMERRQLIAFYLLLLGIWIGHEPDKQCDQFVWLICLKMWGRSSHLKWIFLKWTVMRMVDSKQEKKEEKRCRCLGTAPPHACLLSSGLSPLWNVSCRTTVTAIALFTSLHLSAPNTVPSMWQVFSLYVLTNELMNY